MAGWALVQVGAVVLAVVASTEAPLLPLVVVHYRGMGVASVNFKGFSHFGLESEVGHKFDIRNGLEPSIQFPEQPNRPNSRIHLNSAQFRGAKHALSEF
jgi:hypothetical protein